MGQYLQNLSLKIIMEKKNCDRTASIEHLHDTFNKYTPLGPPSHRSDSSTLENMYGEIAGY